MSSSEPKLWGDHSCPQCGDTAPENLQELLKIDPDVYFRDGHFRKNGWGGEQDDGGSCAINRLYGILPRYNPRKGEKSEK